MLAQPKGAFWTTSQLQQLKVAFKAAGKKLGNFEREVDRDVRTITLDDQGGAGADGEARRPIGGARWSAKRIDTKRPPRS